MIGPGLRRSEVAFLTLKDIQQRDGRWVIVDIVGKGNRVRTLPILAWAKVAIDEWTNAGLIGSGKVFRWVNKGDCISGDNMTAQAVRDVVKEYADGLGYQVEAHDLRRTFAKLAHKSGSIVED